MSEWQPIETAPKDGTRIWLATESVMKRVGRWHDGEAFERHGTIGGGWRRADDSQKESLFFVPTHWMPLPELPKMENDR